MKLFGGTVPPNSCPLLLKRFCQLSVSQLESADEDLVLITKLHIILQCAVHICSVVSWFRVPCITFIISHIYLLGLAHCFMKLIYIYILLLNADGWEFSFIGLAFKANIKKRYVNKSPPHIMPICPHTHIFFLKAQASQ